MTMDVQAADVQAADVQAADVPMADVRAADVARLASVPGSGPEAPRDPVAPAGTEARLAAVWRSALGPKGRDTSRHILHVTFGLKRVSRLLAEAETALGVAIPASALLRLGTVAAVAGAIDRGDWPAPSPLVLLRDGDPAAVLLIPAPGSGVVLEVCDLAALIAFPGQIWGLHAPGIDGEAAPLDRIEDLARHYLDAIRARHPDAVCHVIGYSYAGLVAVEMARLMPAHGLRGGLVGLLDTGCYEKFWPRGAWLRFALKQARRRLREMRRMPRRAALRQLAGKGAALLRHLRRRLHPPASAAGADLTRSIHYTGGYAPDFQRVRDAGLVAYERYRPTRVEARGVLFRSEFGEPHACDPAHLWRPLFRDLEIVDVPGSHTTMVRKPLALTLAEAISRRLTAYGDAEPAEGAPE